jgi:hypothetical protein
MQLHFLPAKGSVWAENEQLTRVQVILFASHFI